MQKEIVLNNKKITYTFRKNRRAKYMRLSIRGDASFSVSVPFRFPEKEVEQFIFSKADWILEKIEYFKNIENKIPFANRKDYLKNKELAREIIQKKVEYFNQFYNFKIGRISIRNQKTRWGSCSRNGNLNFSYRVIYLSERACDYVVVHELSHLGEFNHSQKFWNLVQKTIPDCKKIKKELRNL